LEKDRGVVETMIDQDDFLRTIETIEKKIGITLLSDNDLLVLACNEISKTYTRDEKDY
jgi:hypothetical protein